MKLSRRRFLKRTMASAAVCGLAQLSAANDVASPLESITDTHVYLGHWPHQRLSGDGPPKLIAELRRAGVTQAWAGSFDGLFHKDIAGVNQRLADACARTGDGMLISFGAINPTLPDWEDDIRRCHEMFKMPGVRLHPNYHGYTLDDPRFAKLLELATARGLVVHLVTWMESDRHLLLNPAQPEVNVKPLAEKITALPRLRLIVSNYTHTASDESHRALLKNDNVYFDFARASGADGLKRLIDTSSPKRVVFGSGAPLHNIETTSSTLNGVNSAEVRHQIAKTNSAALLALPQQTSATVSGNPGYEIVSTP